MEVRDDFSDAYRAGNIERMQRDSTLAIDMIIEADWLLSRLEPLSFWTWRQDATNWGDTREEKHYYEKQARTLLTIWGGPVLNDYANRMWGGLLGQYYGQRWKLFFHAVMDASRLHREFDEGEFKNTLAEFENSWCDQKGRIVTYFKDTPSDNAKKILRKIDRGEYAVPNRAAEVLGAYMKKYPEAHLQDVYKSCFQDVYGPGHIIKDSATCARYIVDEMGQTDVSDLRFPDYEPTGVEGNFVRVNLRVLKDGRVPLDLFVRLLMQSADVRQKMPLYDWKGQWDRLQKTLDTLTPRPKNFDADAANLRSWLDRGEVMVHHSRHFNESYAPHYRIIRRDLFEKNLLPLMVGE